MSWFLEWRIRRLDLKIVRAQAYYDERLKHSPASFLYAGMFARMKRSIASMQWRRARLYAIAVANAVKEPT